jgi:hypothetical protein
MLFTIHANLCRYRFVRRFALWSFALWSCVGGTIFFGIISQFIGKVETLLEQLSHTSLSIRNLIADHELAVHSHVVDRIQLVAVSKRFRNAYQYIYLHAVRIELSWCGDAAKFFDLQQTFS